MNDQVRQFRELISSNDAAKKRNADHLMHFKDELKEARSRGFSYEQISEFLGKVGVKISRHGVRLFCVSELGEKPIKKRSKKAKVSSNCTQDKLNHANIKPTSSSLVSSTHSVSGIQSDNSALTNSGISASPSLQNSSVSASSQQSGGNQSSTRRVGPRPGFRIARDDL